MADGQAAGDQRTLDTHLASVAFQAGVEEGRWSVLRYEFPELIVRITGCDFSGAVTSVRDFQLLCDGFPARAAFVQRWDEATRQRPSPPQAPHSPPGLIDALKDWSGEGACNGHGGIYRPWQRYAAMHNAWPARDPHLAWHRDRHLTFIMEHLYALVSDQAAWDASRTPA